MVKGKPIPLNLIIHFFQSSDLTELKLLVQVGFDLQAINYEFNIFQLMLHKDHRQGSENVRIDDPHNKILWIE